MENVPQLKGSRARFVLLHHELQALHAADSHWDLMFETEYLLLTFRLMLLPRANAAELQETHSVERLADHRTMYLDYQGPISGNRGSVKRIAAGEYTVVSQENGRWKVELSAAQLKATLEFSICATGEFTQMHFLAWNIESH